VRRSAINPSRGKIGLGSPPLVYLMNAHKQADKKDFRRDGAVIERPHLRK
jgi:hypothetical protein